MMSATHDHPAFLQRCRTSTRSSKPATGTLFRFLGPHWIGDTGKAVVRSFQPAARNVEVVFRADECKRFGGIEVHEHGLFEITVPHELHSEDYDLVITYHNGEVYRVADPYAFGLCLGEQDMHFFREGTHQRLYEVLGAHLVTRQGVAGVQFAVWAPTRSVCR